jgi:hypothetical protein
MREVMPITAIEGTTSEPEVEISRDGLSGIRLRDTTTSAGGKI